MPISDQGYVSKVYVVVKGKPVKFFDVQEAEDYAASRTYLEHEDYTVFPIDSNALDNAIVSRYKGVVLYTLQEALEERDV